MLTPLLLLLPLLLQFGTVLDDPLDYYGGRLSAKERKATLTEQLLADAELTHSRKKRYAGLQVRGGYRHGPAWVRLGAVCCEWA